MHRKALNIGVWATDSVLMLLMSLLCITTTINLFKDVDFRIICAFCCQLPKTVRLSVDKLFFTSVTDKRIQLTKFISMRLKKMSVFLIEYYKRNKLTFRWKCSFEMAIDLVVIWTTNTHTHTLFHTHNLNVYKLNNRKLCRKMKRSVNEQWDWHINCARMEKREIWSKCKYKHCSTFVCLFVY